MTYIKRILWVVGALVALGALALGALFTAQWIDPQATTRFIAGEAAAGELVGNPAPDFALPLAVGDEVIALSDYRGTVVVLDFWATWCAPCKKTAPTLARLRDERGDFEVIAINVREGERDEQTVNGRVKRYVERSAFPFRYVMGTNDLYEAYKGDGIPLFVVIDKDGIVRYAADGLHDRNNFQAALATAGL